MRLEEYYPNALEDIYKGVSAYIYSVDSMDGDAYDEILRSAAKGKIAICRYEEMAPSQLQWIHDTMIKEYRDSLQKRDYRHFLVNKSPFLQQVCV